MCINAVYDYDYFYRLFRIWDIVDSYNEHLPLTLLNRFLQLYNLEIVLIGKMTMIPFHIYGLYVIVPSQIEHQLNLLIQIDYQNHIEQHVDNRKEGIMTSIIIKSDKTDMTFIDKCHILNCILYPQHDNESSMIDKYIHATQAKNNWDKYHSQFYDTLKTGILLDSNIGIFLVTKIEINGLLRFLTKVYPMFTFIIDEQTPSIIQDIAFESMSGMLQGNVDMRFELDHQLTKNEWSEIEMIIGTHPNRQLYYTSCFWCETHKTWEISGRINEKQYNYETDSSQNVINIIAK